MIDYKELYARVHDAMDGNESKDVKLSVPEVLYLLMRAIAADEHNTPNPSPSHYAKTVGVLSAGVLSDNKH